MIGVADGSSLHLALAGSRLGMGAGTVDLGIEKNGLSVRSVEEIYQYHRLGWRNIVTEAIEHIEQGNASTPASESLDRELEWLKGESKPQG